MPIPRFFVSMWMNLLIYAALAAIGILVVYGISNALAVSSEQRTITVQQQSSSSSSTVTNGNNSTVSSRITSSVGADDLSVDRNLSGKIASTQFNSTSGSIEGVLFGNWSLDSSNGTTNFVATFTRTPFNNTGNVIEYKMSNLQLYSVQQINNNLVLQGRIDVSSNGTTALADVPATIMIQDSILVVGFGRDTQAGNLFSGIPIIGFEEE